VEDEFGHDVPQVTPLSTDAINDTSVEMDGGVDGYYEGGRDEDGDSVGMLVEEDGDVDQVNCCFENRHGLPTVSPLDSKVYSRNLNAEGLGLVAGEDDG